MMQYNFPQIYIHVALIGIVDFWKLKIANQGWCKPDISWKLKITLESFSELVVRRGGSLPLKNV